MKTEHLFLASSTVTATDRWVEAFTSGESTHWQALQARLDRVVPSNCVIWLSSADQQWSEHLQNILSVRAELRVIVLSNAPNPTEGLDALNKGARGYTHAYAVPALLREVALVVEHGGLWVGTELLQRLVAATHSTLTKATQASHSLAVPPDNSALASLSAREIQVARAVAQGLSNKEVAGLICVSEGTVKAHLGSVFEKLGVRDRLQLVVRLAAPASKYPVDGG